MDNLALSQGGSIALGSSVLGSGTTAGTIKTTVTMPYTIDGVFFSKAITDNIAAAVTVPAVMSNGYAVNGSFTGQIGGSTRLYGLYIDGAGNVTLAPGPVVNSAELAGGNAALMFPGNIRMRAAFGVMRVAVTAGNTFVPGTTALAAAGVTVTFLNLMAFPAEPIKV